MLKEIMMRIKSQGMFLFIRTLLPMVLCVLCFTSSAVVVLVEPYIGLYTKGSQTTESSPVEIDKSMESFESLGIRLGASNVLHKNMNAGLDYRASTIIRGKKSFVDSQYLIKQMGAFASYTLVPLLLDIRGTWFFKVSQEEKYFNNYTYNGNGFSIGLSIFAYIIGNININVDYVKTSFNEKKSFNGNTILLSNDISDSEIYISVSFPFGLNATPIAASGQ